MVPTTDSSGVSRTSSSIVRICLRCHSWWWNQQQSATRSRWCWRLLLVPRTRLQLLFLVCLMSEASWLKKRTKSTVTSASPTDKVQSATGCWRSEPLLLPAKTNSSLKQQGTKQSSGFDSAHPSHSFFETPHANSQLDVSPSHPIPQCCSPSKMGETLSKRCNSGQQRQQYQNYRVFSHLLAQKGLMPNGSSKNHWTKVLCATLAANTARRAKMIVREDATENGEWAWVKLREKFRRDSRSTNFTALFQYSWPIETPFEDVWHEWVKKGLEASTVMGLCSAIRPNNEPHRGLAQVVPDSVTSAAGKAKGWSKRPSKLRWNMCRQFDFLRKQTRIHNSSWTWANVTRVGNKTCATATCAKRRENVSLWCVQWGVLSSPLVACTTFANVCKRNL